MAKWGFEPGHTAAEFRANICVSDEVFVSLDVEAILAEDLAQA